MYIEFGDKFENIEIENVTQKIDAPHKRGMTLRHEPTGIEVSSDKFPTHVVRMRLLRRLNDRLAGD